MVGIKISDGKLEFSTNNINISSYATTVGIQTCRYVGIIPICGQNLLLTKW